MPPKSKATKVEVNPSPKTPARKRGSSPAPTSTIRQSKRNKFSANATPEKKAHPKATAKPTPQSRSASKSTSKTTPQKSRYFEHSTEPSDPESEIENEESGYEDEDPLETASASLAGETETPTETEEFTTEDEKPKKRGKGRPAGRGGKGSGRGSKVLAGSGKKDTNSTVAAGKGEKGEELWRPGVKVDVEPGREVFIKLPKAREAGKTPYTDETIHPNTMLFLKDLNLNNDREWLKIHDADYRQAKKDWDTFVEKLTEKIIEKDETVPELPAKDVTFRIYRDVRFSSDPTPYKPYFSAAWSRTGRKGPYAHYYVQIQPGSSFVGSGLWMPDAAPLALLRRDVDGRPHKIKQVLMDPTVRKECFKGCPKDERKAVKAFVEANKVNALKTKPKASNHNKSICWCLVC